MSNDVMGRVLPFARSAEYLRKIADRHRSQGKPLQALEMLRLSAEKAPQDVQLKLEMAETYAAMQCPRLSNAILFPLLKDPDVADECFFDLGSNFYAMQMYGAAQDCLSVYVSNNPDSDEAIDAAEMLQDIAAEQSGEDESELDARIAYRTERALDALEAGEARQAVRLMGRVLALTHKNPGGFALRAFAYLADQNRFDEALKCARRALKQDPRDPRALCAMAASLDAAGSHDTALVFLEKACSGSGAEDEETLRLICRTACDIGAHAHALNLLRKMENTAPYCDEVLYPLAAALYNTGDVEGAIRTWRQLRRINPLDTFSEYALQGAQDGTLPEKMPYMPVIPMEETLERLNRLRGWIREGNEMLKARWTSGSELEALIRWGLTQEENGVCHAMIGVLSGLGDEKARTLLMEFLGDPDASDGMKQEAMAALYTDPQPLLYALTGGRLTRVQVSQVEPGKPDAQMEAFAKLTRKMMGETWQGSDETLIRICQKALLRLPHRFSLLMRSRAIAMALGGVIAEKNEAIPHNKRRRLERCIRIVEKMIEEDPENETRKF